MVFLLFIMKELTLKYMYSELNMLKILILTVTCYFVIVTCEFCNIVYAHCKVKSVRGGALKQNFIDNNTRSVSLSLAVTPALSG